MKRRNLTSEEKLINVNVRGVKMWILQSCIQENVPDSVIAQIISGRVLSETSCDGDGAIYIDSEPYLFGYIIHYIQRRIEFDIVPQMITKEVWFRELRYFGLIDEKKESIKKELVLSEFDESMIKKKRTAIERIESIILLLPKLCPNTGLIENGIRFLEYYIPENIYKTTWNQDLFTYLIEGKYWIELFLKKKNYFTAVEITKIKSTAAKPTLYVFNEISYSSATDNTIKLYLLLNDEIDYC